MKTLTDIEQKSLLTQNNLMKDIIRNYQSITYSMQQAGIQLKTHLDTKKINETEKTVTISRELFDKMEDIAFHLKDEHKWHKLGILAEQAVPDNKIKIDILNQLQE